MRATARRSVDDLVFTQAEIAAITWWRDAYERVRKGLPFMSSPVIDLSHHNSTPNWSTIKSAGVTGVILKATQGVSYVDDTYVTRWHDALSAGLCVSSYHFLEAGNIEDQMAHFLDTADPLTGERLCLDYEDYNGQCPTIDELCDAVAYLWSKRPDVQITIYSGHAIKAALGDNLRYDALDNTSLWIAQYTSASSPTWPKQQWKTWSLWQWTDCETVPGISAPVDGNRWNGSTEALVKWMSPAKTPQPAPAPEPEDIPEVLLDVTVSMSQPVMLRLKVNGEEIVTSAAPLPLTRGASG
jgi:lysozyme